jgi:hypothetical protein
MNNIRLEQSEFVHSPEQTMDYALLNLSFKLGSTMNELKESGQEEAPADMGDLTRYINFKEEKGQITTESSETEENREINLPLSPTPRESIKPDKDREQSQIVRAESLRESTKNIVLSHYAGKN